MRKVKEVFDKVKSNKKMTIITIGLLITLILTWGGVTYSLFNYTNDNVGNNDINSGHISMTYTEPSNEYVVENALPMKDEEGMNSTNYFEFSVTTKAPTNDTDDEGISIPYEITITETEGNTLTNEQIKMYLSEVEGEKEVEHKLPTFISYLEPSIYKDNQIKVGFNLHLHRNGNETITTKYRLRAWLDYDVDVSDWKESNLYQYKFKVNVNGDVSFQGYRTEESCFTYELNDNNNYSITGYDFLNCETKNIIVPEYINNIKVDTIASFSNIEEVEAVSNYKNINSVNNLNNVVSEYKTNISTIADEKPIINSILIPEDITIIDGAFSEVEVHNFYDRSGEFTQKCFVHSGSTITNYLCTGISYVIIPAVIDNKNISAIGNHAFSTNQLINVVIPETITNIGQYAFYNNLLTSVVIPNSVTKIGQNAFEGNQLVSISVPKSLTTLEQKVFANNQLTSIKIPDSVTSIRNNAFANNQLTSIKIPDSVTSIRNNAFANNQLTSIEIPDSVTSIGSHAFYNNQISSIVFPDNISIIEDHVFEYNQLTSISIPNTVASIGACAFQYNRITHVNIPDSVTSIGNSCFRNNKIEKIFIPDSVVSIGEMAFNNNSISVLDLGNSVKTIGRFAFFSNNFSEVKIPNSVLKIGVQAFGKNQNQNLKKIVNLTGREFDWMNIISGTSSDPFVTGTIGNVEIVAE